MNKFTLFLALFFINHQLFAEDLLGFSIVKLVLIRKKTRNSYYNYEQS